MIPEKYRPHVIRRNGDVLPTVLVDGRVAGVWRHVDDGIEVAAFHDLTSETLSALEPEAVALDELISERDPTTYRRHHHWWDSLPTVPRTSFRRP